MTIVDVIDILLVTLLIYRLLTLVQGTRAWRIVLGIVTFVLLLFGSAALKLHTLHWILEKATILGPVALVILFLPEVRQTIESFGKLGFWPQNLVGVEERAEAKTVEEIVAAVSEMAATRVGAIIVIEKGTPLDEIVSNGVLLDAKVSAPLLGSIFYDGNPLHDGAVVVRKDSLVAAACRLPLSESPGLDPHLHMRHRAAVGVTEGHDCISVVVSEERGTISFIADGKLQRLADHTQLREILNRELRRLDDRPRNRDKRRQAVADARKAKAAIAAKPEEVKRS